MGRVLLVDDEPAVLYANKELLVDRGHEAVTAASGAEALLKLEGVDAAVVDLAMPGMDGIELIEKIRERDASLPVVLLTAHGSERIAVRALKTGAYDYLPKPFDIDEIIAVVERAIEARRLRVENKRLSAEQAIGRRIISTSESMRRLLDAVTRIADKDVTVLLRGETGTGKELIGALIHAHSRRKDKPLVRFNCAAIPGELADAELFGHAKGAFTGAVAARDGYFAQASGGTLILDEIGETPLPLQAKLLRAIQEGEIQPVGGRIEKVDVRIVASTNRDLLAEVRAGRFREDLYYRLAVIELVIPPLRERREDIVPLAVELARRLGEKLGTGDTVLSPALLDLMKRADWPGNVRQLENTLARMLVMNGGPELGPAAFSELQQRSGSEPESGDLTLDDQVEAFERGLIARTLSAVRGNQSEAARRLGVNRVTLIGKIKRYQLAPTGEEA